VSGVLILGAGGHGKVIADILLAQGTEVLGFLDDTPAAQGTTRLGLPVLGPIDSLLDYHPSGLILGIGENRARKMIAERLGSAVQNLWCNAIHPRATISPFVHLGRGVVIAAHVAINPDTILGDHVIINTGATVDHDCRIGDYAHIAPGSHLAGTVTIGAGTLVGVGTAIIPGRSVGAWSVIGAGSVVVRDIGDGVTAKGVPARTEQSQR
jgi:sugar O-acyltransferase (sialic acid O-acetyltransferase NeuD family)